MTLVFSTILAGGFLIGGAWTGWDWLTSHGFGFWGFLGLIWLGLCIVGGVVLVLDSVSRRWKRLNIHSVGDDNKSWTPAQPIHRPE